MDKLMTRISLLPVEIEEKIYMYAHYMAFKPINYEFKYLLNCIYRSKLLKNNRFKINKLDDITDYPNWGYIFNKSLYSYIGRKNAHRCKHNLKQYAIVIRSAFPCIFEKLKK